MGDEDCYTEGKKRFRRRGGKGSGLSDVVYQRIKSKLLRGELSPAVAVLKREAKGADNAYEAIDRLLKEGVVYQAENGRYQVVNAHNA